MLLSDGALAWISRSNSPSTPDADGDTAVPRGAEPRHHNLPWTARRLSPRDRAEAAARRIESIVEARSGDSVEARPVPEGVLVTVAGRASSASRRCQGADAECHDQRRDDREAGLAANATRGVGYVGGDGHGCVWNDALEMASDTRSCAPMGHQ